MIDIEGAIGQEARQDRHQDEFTDRKEASDMIVIADMMKDMKNIQRIVAIEGMEKEHQEENLINMM